MERTDIVGGSSDPRDLVPDDLASADQRWLDERIKAAERGAGAVIDILNEWTTGRAVGRLHPGQTAIGYIRQHAPSFRLGRSDVPLLLTETNLSHSAIAEVTGVSHQTVGRDAGVVQMDKSRVGLDGKPALGGRPRVLRTVVAEVLDVEPEPEPSEPDAGPDMAAVQPTATAGRAGSRGYRCPRCGRS